MNRPDDLPDFRSPPLNEVVLGVQFKPAAKYQQILAGEVWALFRADFPNIEEQAALAPTFETFGVPGGPHFGFGLISGASHDRFWFLSREKEELIQFQPDRLLHNWRKVGDERNEYPRFEKMIQKFEAELKSLERYFSALAPQQLDVNQCEISYINHIPVGDQGLNPSDWLRVVSFEKNPPTDFSLIFRDVIHDSDGKPYGRLICEVVSALNTKGESIIRLTLTARGAPLGSDIEAAVDFLTLGRERVVNRFTAITTDAAHRRWERVR